MKKVLIIDYFEEEFLLQLSNNQKYISYIPEITRQELLTNSPNVGCIVLKSKTHIDAEFIRYYPDLQEVIRAGAGVDHIDTALLKEKNIRLVTTNAGNRDAVGEHTTGLLLSLLNYIPRAHAEVQSFIWTREANRGYEIKGKTVGIIGYGNMGSAFAEKISGFGAQVIAYDKYKTNFSSAIVKEVQLQDIFEQTDILSLHVPLTSETHYLVHLDFIQQFNKNFWLLNLARGPVVNTKDLLSALKSGKIKGAALDVLENENFQSLNSSEKQVIQQLSQQNVIFTPHIGGWTFESARNINQLVAQSIQHFIQSTILKDNYYR